MTFADKAIAFDRQLHYTGKPLPPGIRIMNPFKESDLALPIAEAFYHKFYNDRRPRYLVLGINPSRLGAGLTGVPFTDPKRLVSVCGIPYPGKMVHEPSSVFIYRMIEAYGGPEAFYGDLYINSPCPLGFISVDAHGKEKNYNYYDSKALQDAVYDFMVTSMRQLLTLDLHRDTCFCLGTGKNYRFLQQLNHTHQFFERIIPLEHPRYILQYKSAQEEYYICKYLEAFRQVRVD